MIDAVCNIQYKQVGSEQLSSIRQEYHTAEAQRCRTEPRERLAGRRMHAAAAFTLIHLHNGLF
jgi:hypothetical protein